MIMKIVVYDRVICMITLDEMLQRSGTFLWVGVDIVHLHRRDADCLCSPTKAYGG